MVFAGCRHPFPHFHCFASRSEGVTDWARNEDLCCLQTLGCAAAAPGAWAQQTLCGGAVGALCSCHQEIMSGTCQLVPT